MCLRYRRYIEIEAYVCRLLILLTRNENSFNVTHKKHETHKSVSQAADSEWNRMSLHVNDENTMFRF